MKNNLKLTKSTLVIILFFIIVIFIFFRFVGINYYSNNAAYNLGADSGTYYRICKMYKFSFDYVIRLGQNLLGPLVLLKIIGFNTIVLFLFNSILLLFAIQQLFKYIEIDRLKFVVFFFINPLIIGSLLLVNKEITGLVSIVLFLIYIKQKKIFFLFLAFVFAFMTRWQQAFVYAIYLYVGNQRLSNIYKSRLHIIVILVLLISVVFPVLFGLILPNIYSVSTYKSQLNGTFGNFLSFLNYLQENFMFFIVVIPKALLNLIGNIFRIKDLFMDPVNYIKQDVYNNLFILGHQVSMFIILSLLWFKNRMSYRSDLIFLSIIYVIIFSLSMMVQYRYFFPIYILLVAELCSIRECRDNYK